MIETAVWVPEFRLKVLGAYWWLPAAFLCKRKNMSGFGGALQ